MKKVKSKVSNINHLTVDEFNNLYPVGTEVRYWPCYTQPDEYIETLTTSPAWELCSGVNVVCLAHGAGGYCFDNIAVIGVST